MHDTLLPFGATGGLAQRGLFPSLLHLWRGRRRPAGLRLVAVTGQPRIACERLRVDAPCGNP